MSALHNSNSGSGNADIEKSFLAGVTQALSAPLAPFVALNSEFAAEKPLAPPTRAPGDDQADRRAAYEQKLREERAGRGNGPQSPDLESEPDSERGDRSRLW
jgi:hypothetical protein